jgi:hypothetical protein
MKNIGFSERNRNTLTPFVHTTRGPPAGLDALSQLTTWAIAATALDPHLLAFVSEHSGSGIYEPQWYALGNAFEIRLWRPVKNLCRGPNSKRIAFKHKRSDAFRLPAVDQTSRVFVARQSWVPTHSLIFRLPSGRQRSETEPTRPEHQSRLRALAPGT